MMREQISQHILELCQKHKLTHKDFKNIIHKDERTAQNRFKLKNWTFEEIELIEAYFGEKILFLAKEIFAQKNSNQIQEPIEATLQIKLKKDKKDQVLKLVFGENNLEILNK